MFHKISEMISHWYKKLSLQVAKKSEENSVENINAKIIDIFHAKRKKKDCLSGPHSVG